jgi:hypothetical protein
VLATEFINSPETPKSQILISPEELTRMLDGLMSVCGGTGAETATGEEVMDRV